MSSDKEESKFQKLKSKVKEQYQQVRSEKSQQNHNERTFVSDMMELDFDKDDQIPLTKIQSIKQGLQFQYNAYVNAKQRFTTFGCIGALIGFSQALYYNRGARNRFIAIPLQAIGAGILLGGSAAYIPYAYVSYANRQQYQNNIDYFYFVSQDWASSKLSTFGKFIEKKKEEKSQGEDDNQSRSH